MSTIKVNTIETRTGSTLTLGKSGDTVSIASGASTSGMGRTGAVDWQTSSIKTESFTGVNGEGYFIDTSDGTPFKNYTTTVATGTNYAAYHKMTLSSVTGLAVDDEIRDASADGSGVAVSKIVSITGNVVSHIPQANNAGGYVNFSSTDTVFKGASSIGTVSSVDSTFPEIVKYSGNIMYVENRGAVTRAADQIEDIKLIIQM